MAGGDLGSVGGSSHPCSLPRIWGRLHGSVLFYFRRDIARVWHCVPGLERGMRKSKMFCLALEIVESSRLVTRVLGDGTFHVHRLLCMWFGVAYTEVCCSAFVETSGVCGTASRVGN